MLIAGLCVLLFRLDKNHFILCLALLAYWMAGGFIQDLVSNNSIPKYNAGLAMFVALIAIHVSRDARLKWPLWIAFIMALTILNDAAHMWTMDAGLTGFNRRFQDITYILYFMSLLTLAHPIRGQRNENETFAYA